MDILQKIKIDREVQLEREKQNYKVASFKNALKQEGLSIIGEIKRASPSAGDIAEKDFNPIEQFNYYAKNGVKAVSVLTEEKYFKGHNDILKTVHNENKDIAILRKDFIFDSFQVFEAKVIGASAVLLIVRMLKDEQLRYLHKLAYELGLDVLVEVHDEIELNRALNIPNLQILGVNNRNLDTFEVDIKTTERLLETIPSNIRKNLIVVSESGYRSNEDLEYAKKMGVDAVLVGEALMRGDIKL